MENGLWFEYDTLPTRERGKVEKYAIVWRNSRLLFLEKASLIHVFIEENMWEKYTFIPLKSHSA